MITSARLTRHVGLPLVALLAVMLTACGGGPATDGGADRGTATVTNGVAEISANNLAFDVATIQAPAGEAFTIRLTNLESLPHDVAVYTEEGGQLLASVDPISGPDQSVDLAVPALDAGAYFFVCRVHATTPEMLGTLVVGP